jgi:hypothetical protein
MELDAKRKEGILKKTAGKPPAVLVYNINE